MDLLIKIHKCAESEKEVLVEWMITEWTSDRVSFPPQKKPVVYQQPLLRIPACSFIHAIIY